MDLHRKNLDKVEVKFRYSIRITNEGDIAGYAKEIKDYIPEGLKFIKEDNPGWEQISENVIVTNLLADKLLEPGESAEVEVLLTWIKGKENLGLKVNTAEISKDYNDKGIPDRDSTPDNKKPGEVNNKFSFKNFLKRTYMEHLLYARTFMGYLLYTSTRARVGDTQTHRSYDRGRSGICAKDQKRKWTQGQGREKKKDLPKMATCSPPLPSPTHSLWS